MATVTVTGRQGKETSGVQTGRHGTAAFPSLSLASPCVNFRRRRRPPVPVTVSRSVPAVRVLARKSQLASSPPPPVCGLPSPLLGGANRQFGHASRQIYQPPSSRQRQRQRQDCRRQRRAGCAMRMRVLPASWSSSSTKHSSGSSESQEHPSPSSTTAAVYLNIYDISPLNHYLYWFGLGIFHSGIEVHGMEYGFGAHEYPTSGVFQVEPKSCPGFIFRRSVCVGTTHMSRTQVHTSIEDLAEDYHGDTYHLIVKNCNHFTADVCKHLTGKPVPGWVNRLARLGSFFNCVLPDSIKVSAVRDVSAHPDFSDDDLGSNASILEGSDDDDLDQLLRTLNSDIVSSRDKTLTPGRDSV